jgi:hypothetical protein
MWRLGLDGSGGDREESRDVVRPSERSGEADCSYYLRTSDCGFGFGERCDIDRQRQSAMAFSEAPLIAGFREKFEKTHTFRACLVGLLEPFEIGALGHL